MVNYDMEMNLRENIVLGINTPISDRTLADVMTARAEQHSKGNENTSAEKALEIQKLYFNSMIHELNNFMLGIQNGIDLAKAELRKNKDEAELLLEQCERASYNSICLIRNYSIFLKNGDANHYEYKKIDVVDIARTSAKMLLRDSRINFLFGTDNMSECVSGDEIQIYQLFHNLLKNAKEAMLDNGITIKIDISRTNIGMYEPDGLVPGEYIRINISDNGSGIDKRNIEYLFDPYFTLKKTGTGLGLSVCHGIVRRHKGSIRVNSTLGKGTVFTVLLPLAKII